MYDEMSSSYLSYAMSVIVSRALPDIRDGLKPVHRRIIYAMHKGGFDWSKQYRKSARIVGDVIGRYHPHGDQAVYDALVRMVQDFSMSLPLIDGQGNFGSVDGDPPAAMRYTETRLAKISQNLIDDIDKDTVEFKSNYDETEKEPEVLPAQYPNLLVNGAGGIAVGMATSIPPHNLSEVINATLALIDNKDIKINELMKHIPGPDFPTGGTIIGKDIIKTGYKTGRGSFKVRGDVSIEQLKNGKERLVINSIPYQINKSVLNEKIVELIRNKKIDGISDIRDESNREGIRVAIDLKRNIEPETVKRQLYKYTSLESSFSFNTLAIVDRKPKNCNLKDFLESFPNANVIIIENSNKFGLSQLHQLRGRVGRGNKESFCILMFKNNLSKNARKRINILKENNDGFKISEEDMKLRGYGDLLGFKQSGIQSFRLADPVLNENLFLLAEKEIKKIEKDNIDLDKFQPLLKLYDRADILNDIV